ncbi:hypothetical protein MLD38_025203 [Melastoma candidum]|uniref:Uncharacterized protein n=1 Tax=Melastoma candidum TaxID=119954 RepID=A0ACB9NV35_9MYRT|nr:hypothetical protein MLD38_025203 [Melastoma candidum]
MTAAKHDPKTGAYVEQRLAVDHSREDLNSRRSLPKGELLRRRRELEELGKDSSSGCADEGDYDPVKVLNKDGINGREGWNVAVSLVQAAKHPEKWGYGGNFHMRISRVARFLGSRIEAS